MRLHLLLGLAVCCLLPAPSVAQEVLDPPSVLLKNVPFDITLQGGNAPAARYEVRSATGATLASGTLEANSSVTARGLTLSTRAELPLTVVIGDTTQELSPTLTSGWFSILPPLIAIALALIFREVVTALFAGVWLGALAVAGFNPFSATARLIDTFVVPTMANEDHAAIMAFSLLLGGMVGLIARNGGTQGIVEAVAPFARTPRRGKVATWAAGMAIFFDDYANTLIVGNTMRPITDRLKISREKLAYLVDSTAAPVAALVPISTWVGYEITLIGDGVAAAAEQTPAGAEALLAVSPFGIFLQTIPYLFYPLLALIFVLMTSLLNRDLGPMAAAERRASRGEGLYRPGAVLAADTTSSAMEPKDGVPHRWWNAAIPVATVVLVVLIGLYSTGRAETGPGANLMDVFGAANPFSTLLWGSLAGVLVAVALSAGQRLLSLQECIESLVGGMRAMMIAMIILVLAWSLGDVTAAVGTSDFLALLLSDRVAVPLLPVIVFITSAAMAFATGTSWGTMAIMLPVVIPLVVALGGPDVLPGGSAAPIFFGGIASVLAGSIFGDHCSPISDTTVLSSTASACDHVDHVRTQLPYALLVAAVAMVVGNVGTAYGLSPWIALAIGVAVLFGVLRVFGARMDEAEG
ncbi:MAG: Na+/H+ antiporter NhaC family protein [Gemmatimonadetes bacterium]|nr:Na+/H+ antiporter NhaC family protein [Gemmatimonadota bacterium]MDA1104043.1 Na+/H+ antiporter NhaC family protein [Gemmatimonadota bacterium]